LNKNILAIGITILFIFTIFNPITLGNKDLSSTRNGRLINSKLVIEHHYQYHRKDTSDFKSIIWNNGGPTDDWILILSQLDEVFPFNAQVADDFIFEDENMEVLGVRFWGNFWGVGQPLDQVDFNIFFYEDDGTGNAPTGEGMENPESTALASYFIEGVSSVNDSGQRFYYIDLPSPFLALEGEKYWLVVQAVFEVLPKWGRVTNDGTIHLSPSVYGCPQLSDPFWMDLGYGDMAWYLTGGINEQPDEPIIDGPKNGRIGVEYEYNFSLFDPEEDSMYIRIDWENGPGKWDGPFHSGSVVSYNYTWKKKGTYKIRAQTQDIYGLDSEWGELEVTMPRDRHVQNFPFLRFIERLIYFFPILRNLMRI
jgi:hypothetical protein